MKTYRMRKNSPISWDHATVTVLEESGDPEFGVHTTERPLRHRARHSPTGMSWGYGGSGPSDLALSILWDHLDRQPSTPDYMDFKFDFLVDVPDEFDITGDEIDTWLSARQYTRS